MSEPLKPIVPDVRRRPLRGAWFHRGRGFRAFVLTAIVLLVCSLRTEPQQRSTGERSGNNSPLTEQLPETLLPSCPKETYKPVPTTGDPPVDIIAKLMTKHKRFRLVIGVDKNKHDGSSLEFVKNTAELVDKRLDALDYEPLPSVASPPYLTGARANHTAIENAIDEMVQLTEGDDSGIIYYVGHGMMTKDHSDLSLAVYDEPLLSSRGIRFRELVGTLAVGVRRINNALTQIPHILIVLDTCFSGNVTYGSTPELTEENGLQRLVTVNKVPIPPSVAVITATWRGDDVRSYELRGRNVSAFGFFFARALNESEDWACADTDSPDGIMTLHELRYHLKKRLRLAYDHHAVQGRMNPQLLEQQERTFVAYAPQFHAVDGARNEIHELLVYPDIEYATKISFSKDGYVFRCAAPSTCEIPVSRNYDGPVFVQSVPTGFALGPSQTRETTLAKLEGEKIAGVSFKFK